MSKGYINEPTAAGRIVAHGKITSLTNGFKLEGGIPFSIYVKPKNSSSALCATITGKCWMDDDAAETPITFYEWSPCAFSEIASGQNSMLSDYDIYWGAGWVK